MCAFNTGGSTAYQAVLSLLVSPPTLHPQNVPLHPGGGASGAVEQALGAQRAILWLDTPRQGWTVAVAPGLLDLPAARAAILTALGERFSAEQVTYLDERLTLLPTPYSWAELTAVERQVPGLLPPGLLSSMGISCDASDAVRLEIMIGPAGTPDVVAQVQAALGRFGDMVYVSYDHGFPTHPVGQVPAPPLAPAPAPAPARIPAAAPRIAEYVTVPRTGRCVRGRAVGVSVKKRADVRSVTLAAGKRRVTARSGKRARLALKQRSTRVTVTVKLRDGRAATKTLTYTRCL